jgi:hypothetical protein
VLSALVIYGVLYRFLDTRAVAPHLAEGTKGAVPHPAAPTAEELRKQRQAS